MDYRQRMAIQYKNIEKLKTIINKRFEPFWNDAGIYILTREESGFKYAYVGQSRQPIIKRLAEHLSGYSQHIDRSLYTHKLYTADNPTGWKIDYIESCGVEALDQMEQFWIKEYANKGYQLRNKTGGAQGQGKFGIAEYKPNKGYYDGIKQGYTNALKDIRKLEQQRKEVKKDGTPTKIALKAQEQFNQIVKGETE